MCAIKINRARNNEICIFISNAAKDIFCKFQQNKTSDVEACGILIGNHSLDRKQIKVKFATAPQAGDTRGKHHFKINTPVHQEILNRQFKLSNNEDIYLGTWHTHPEKIPEPSLIDVQDWKKQYHTNKHLFNKMIFAIVGIDIVNFWIIYGNKLRKLEKRNIDYE
jgi:integrative and conjugative element protein (TIGR02256 family)